MTPNIRAFYAQKYEAEYQRLNENQRQAVDAIYGPVLVVAGPGTGKTQMLALRVCKILNETDADASNILCLTFTEAGTVAMRNRLVSFMGPDAYKVGIYTFHGFCNKVIRENPEYFGDYFNLQNADEVELHEVIVELIEQLPLNHPLKRNTGDRLYDVGRFTRVFSAMKQEEWSEDTIETAYQQYSEMLPTMEEYLYKGNFKGNKKGDPKWEQIKAELKKYDFVRNAAPLISTYQDLLQKRGRIDFNDSVLWVVNALKRHDELKLRYQEQFQFVLADEYQDTNGVQNDILFMLGDYDPQPNLFVVGDDDQAIYRFQGANLHNITGFCEKFDPSIVVLDVNYRSTQHILNSAMQLIDNNQERLIHQLKGLTKKLTAGKEFEQPHPAPQLRWYKNPASMELGLVDQIGQLHADGVAYKDIAIIYRNHKDAESLIQYYTRMGIPINVKKKVDVLIQPEIKRLINLLDFISRELEKPDSGRYLLFEILHYDFWGLKPLDLGKIAIHASRASREDGDTGFLWRVFLADENALNNIGVAQAGDIVRSAAILENLIGAVGNHTAQVLLEKVITETGMMEHILKSPNAAWRLQLMNRFFDYVKDLTGKDGDMNISDILQTIEKRKKFGIELPYSSILVADDGINFVSAHGSKGLEFPYVFILSASKKSWLDKPSDNAKFPPTLLRKSGDGNDEDERRLFYVAMTRAERELSILAPIEDANGKPLDTLLFITELGYEIKDRKVESTNEQQLISYLRTSMSEVNVSTALIDRHMVEAALPKLEMNATGVSKFLKCPITFYFENILRVPSARKPAPGYGNAIHFALEKYFLYWADVKTDSVPPLDKLLEYFIQGMEKFKSHFTPEELESHLYEGKNALTRHYTDHAGQWNLPRQHRVEMKIKSELDGIPITGIIDRLSQYDDHFEVLDYKTGKYDSSKFTRAADDDPETDKNGGDYWRQAVFYRILTEKQKEGKGRFGGATFQFINASEEDAKVKTIEVNQEDVTRVTRQIKYVYDKISTHDFSRACGECHWCLFVSENMGLDQVLPDYAEEDRGYPEISVDD